MIEGNTIAISQFTEEDTIEIVNRNELPDEITECIYDAFYLGHQMRQSGGFTINHCPFQPDSELAIAWKSGFYNTSALPSRRVRPIEKVNWKYEGF